MKPNKSGVGTPSPLKVPAQVLDGSSNGLVSANTGWEKRRAARLPAGQLVISSLLGCLYMYDTYVCIVPLLLLHQSNPCDICCKIMVLGTIGTILDLEPSECFKSLSLPQSEPSQRVQTIHTPACGASDGLIFLHGLNGVGVQLGVICCGGLGAPVAESRHQGHREIPRSLMLYPAGATARSMATLVVGSFQVFLRTYWMNQ